MKPEALDQQRFALQRALFERLDWQVAGRDDPQVAAALATQAEVDAVYRLDQAGLLDIFMVYLTEIGFIDYLSQLKVQVRQRFMVPVVTLLLTYMTKTLLGVGSVYTLPVLLFTDTGIMKVLGFNAHWLENGLCHRSHEKRRPGKDPPKPFCAQMLATFLADLLVRESAAFFNQAIHCLARFGAFPRTVTLVLDATDVATTERCQGAGCVTRVRTQKNRSGRLQSIEVTVFGFKAIMAFDLSTQLPVACIVTKIQRHETRYTRRLIRQAETNLATGNSRIVRVLVDRGFLDGETLWWLDHQGIAFVVPARSDLLVYRAARAGAEHGRGVVQRRQRTVNRGHGNKRHQEILATEVIGVTGLTVWEQYSDPAHKEQRRRRGFRPQPINAVVVRKWDNEDYGPGGQVVFLTNQPVDQPLAVFDDYDGRSLIENVLFREGKQGWHLEAIPQKTQRAAVAHIFITFTMVALTTAFREWQRRQTRTATARAAGCGRGPRRTAGDSALASGTEKA